jgi:hypothetical protein
MAAEKIDVGAPTSMSDEEMQVPFSGPAIFANKIYVTSAPTGIRLAFGEQYGDKVEPVFRAAVMLAFPDAESLRDLLTRTLERIETFKSEPGAWHAAPRNQ